MNSTEGSVFALYVADLGLIPGPILVPKAWQSCDLSTQIKSNSWELLVVMPKQKKKNIQIIKKYTGLYSSAKTLKMKNPNSISMVSEKYFNS